MPDGGRATVTGAGLGAGVVSLANCITLARLCCVPLAVWLILRQHMALAFWLFLCAGLSDALDGWLARRRGGSMVGAMLDPIADKALLVSMYVTLAATGRLPDALAILVVFRDLLIIGGVLALSVLGLPLRIAPLRLSKLNTVLQIALVADVLLLAAFPPIGLAQPGRVLAALVWLVGASTILSGAAYVHATARLR